MGLRGEVVVDVITDDPEVRFAPGAAVHSEEGRSWVVATTRWQSGRLVVSFDSVADRTQAEAITGAVLQAWVDADDRPEHPEEYYDRHLLGLRVRRPDGTEVGFVSDITHSGAQDLLSIQIGEDVRQVPFVTQLVPEVDLRAGYLVVADLPGLLDDEGV